MLREDFQGSALTSSLRRLSSSRRCATFCAKRRPASTLHHLPPTDDCANSVNLALLNFFFRTQRKPRFDFSVARDQRDDMLSHYRAMLESMSGTAATEPGVFK